MTGGRIAERERALLFSKQETIPDLKKEMLHKKQIHQEHNFRKILQRKATFWSILPEDMQSEDVHNLWQEENSSPLAINYGHPLIAYLQAKYSKRFLSFGGFF